MEPVAYAASLVRSRPEIELVELSCYTNMPESLLDVREKHPVTPAAMHSYFHKLAGQLRPDQEVAFHSRVRLRIREGVLVTRHVPLVDFKTPDADVATRASEDLIRENKVTDAALFASGRSYHLYLDALMSTAQWVRFMGRLLLLNPREGPGVIDTRWIGHRLMAGFGALRWSANTAFYSRPPQLLRRWG